MEYYVNDPTNYHKKYSEDELCPSCDQPMKYHYNEWENRNEYLCENIFCRVSRVWILNTKK